jgi:putative hemolysin
MEIAILLALILLNGLFAMSEIALVTARKARLQRQIEAGDRGAIAAVKLGEDPTRFLSTVQIGITSIGVLNGVVGESTLAAPLAVWLQGFGIASTTAGYMATAIVVAGLTYFSIVLGELVPKRLGQMAPEAIARLAARPISFLAVASKPFVKLLSGSTQLVLRMLGVKSDRGPAVTEEEIHALLVEGSEAGVIERHEHTMVRNVFRLDDRQLASLMVPRGDVVYLDVESTEEDNLRRIEESDHSRFPVVRGGMHDILGVVSARQLLARRLRGEKADLTAVLQAAVFVPESVTGMELLENFRSSGGQIAFVIDEYGEVLGLVTLQDLDGWRGMGHPARRRLLAAGRPDPDSRTQGPHRPAGGAGRRQGALSHAVGHAAAIAGPAAADGRYGAVGRLEVRDHRHGWQAYRQGAGLADSAGRRSGTGHHGLRPLAGTCRKQTTTGASGARFLLAQRIAPGALYRHSPLTVKMTNAATMPSVV